MEFEEFARAERAALRSSAFWLSGNWHTAEDLAQATLVKGCARWWALRRPARAGAFARTTLTRTWIDWQRRGSAREVPAEYVADRAVGESGVPPRQALLAAVELLPPVQSPPTRSPLLEPGSPTAGEPQVPRSGEDYRRAQSAHR